MSDVNFETRIYLYDNEETLDESLGWTRKRPEFHSPDHVLTDYLISFDYEKTIEAGVVIAKCSFTFTNAFGVFTAEPTSYSPDPGYEVDPRFTSQITIKKGMSIAIVVYNPPPGFAEYVVYHGKIDSVSEDTHTISVETIDYFSTWKDADFSCMYVVNSFVRTPTRWSAGVDLDGYLQRLEKVSDIIKDILYTSSNLDYLFYFDEDLDPAIDIELEDTFYIEMIEKDALQVLKDLSARYSLVFEIGYDVDGGTDEIIHILRWKPIPDDISTVIAEYAFVDISYLGSIPTPPPFVIGVIEDASFELGEEEIKNVIYVTTEMGRFTLRNWDSIHEYGERKMNVDATEMTEEEAIAFTEKLLTLYSKPTLTGTMNVNNPSVPFTLQCGKIYGVGYPRVGVGTPLAFENMMLDTVGVSYDGHYAISVGVSLSHRAKEEVLIAMGIATDEDVKSSEEDTDKEIYKNINIDLGIAFENVEVEHFGSSQTRSYSFFKDYSTITPGDWDDNNVITYWRRNDLVPSYYNSRTQDDSDSGVTNYGVVNFIYSYDPQRIQSGGWLDDYLTKYKVPPASFPDAEDKTANYGLLSKGKSQGSCIRIQGIPGHHWLDVSIDETYEIYIQQSVCVVDIYSPSPTFVRFCALEWDEAGPNNIGYPGEQIIMTSDWKFVPSGGWTTVELQMNLGHAAIANNNTGGFADNTLTLQFKSVSADSEWDILVSNARVYYPGNSQHLNDYSPFIPHHLKSRLQVSQFSAPDSHDQREIISLIQPDNTVSIPEYMFDIDSSIQFKSITAGFDFFDRAPLDEGGQLQNIDGLYGRVGISLMDEQVPRLNPVLGTEHTVFFTNFTSPPSGSLGDKCVVTDDHPPGWEPGDIYECQGGTTWTQYIDVLALVPYVDALFDDNSTEWYVFVGTDNHGYSDSGWDSLYNENFPPEFRTNWIRNKFFEDDIVDWEGGPGLMNGSHIWLEGITSADTDYDMISGDRYNAHYSVLESLHALQISTFAGQTLSDAGLVVKLDTPFSSGYERYFEKIDLNLYGFNAADLSSLSTQAPTMTISNEKVLRRRMFADGTQIRRPSISDIFDPLLDQDSGDMIDWGTRFLAALNSYFAERSRNAPPMYAILSTSTTPSASNSIVCALKENMTALNKDKVVFDIPILGWDHLATQSDVKYIDGTTLGGTAATFTNIFICNAFYYFVAPGGSVESDTMRYSSIFEFELTTPIAYDSQQYGHLIRCSFDVVEDTESVLSHYNQEHTNLTEDGLYCIAHRIAMNTNPNHVNSIYTEPILSTMMGINYLSGTYDSADRSSDVMIKPFTRATITGEERGSSVIGRTSLQRLLNERGIIEDVEKFDYVREIALSTGLTSQIVTHPLAYRGKYEDVISGGSGIDYDISSDKREITMDYSALLPNLVNFTADVLRIIDSSTEFLKRSGENAITIYPREQKMTFSQSQAITKPLQQLGIITYHHDFYNTLNPYYVATNTLAKLHEEGYFSFESFTSSDTYHYSPIMENCLRIFKISATTSRVLVPSSVIKGSITLDSPQDINSVGGSTGYESDLPAIMEKPNLATLMNKGKDITSEYLQRTTEIDDDILDSSSYFRSDVVLGFSAKTKSKWKFRKGFVMKSLDKGKFVPPKKLGWRFYKSKPKKTIDIDTSYDYQAPFMIVAFPIPDEIDVDTLSRIELSIKGGGIIQDEEGRTTYQMSTYIMNNKNSLGAPQWEKINGLSGNMNPNFIYKAEIGDDQSKEKSLSTYFGTPPFLYFLFIIPVMSDQERNLLNAKLKFDMINVRMGEIIQNYPLRQGIDYLYNWYSRTGTWSADELTNSESFVTFPEQEFISVSEELYTVRKPKATTQLEKYSINTQYDTFSVELPKDAFLAMEQDDQLTVTINAGSQTLSSRSLAQYYNVWWTGPSNTPTIHEDLTVASGISARLQQIMPASSGDYVPAHGDDYPFYESYNRENNTLNIGIVNEKLRQASGVDTSARLWSEVDDTKEFLKKYVLASLTLESDIDTGENKMKDGYGSDPDDSDQDPWTPLRICTHAQMQIIRNGLRTFLFELVSPVGEWTHIVVDIQTSPAPCYLRYAKYSTTATGQRIYTYDVSTIDTLHSDATHVYYRFRPGLVVKNITPGLGGTDFRWEDQTGSHYQYPIEQIWPITRIPINTTTNVLALSSTTPTYTIAYEKEEGKIVARTVLYPGRMKRIENIFGDEIIYVSHNFEFVVTEPVP